MAQRTCGFKFKYAVVVLHALLYSALVVYTLVYLRSESTVVRVIPLENVTVFAYLSFACTLPLCTPPSLPPTGYPSEGCKYVNFYGPLLQQSASSNTAFGYAVFECLAEKNSVEFKGSTTAALIPFLSLSEFNVSQELINNGWSVSTSQPNFCSTDPALCISFYLPFQKIFGYNHAAKNAGSSDTVFLRISRRVIGGTPLYDIRIQEIFPASVAYVFGSPFRIYLADDEIVETVVEYQYKEVVYLGCLLFIVVAEIVVALVACCRSQVAEPQPPKLPHGELTSLIEGEECENETGMIGSPDERARWSK